jgi:hypothetical protein
MLGLSRLLESAGEIILQADRSEPRPVRRLPLGVEELEGRVVPSLLGQQLFPSDYPSNQNIANAPVAANSAAIISHIGSSIRIHPDWGDDSPANGNRPLYGVPFNVVHGNTTPKVSVIIDNYPGESDLSPVPIPANAVIEGDYQNGPNPNGPGYGAGQRGDSHLIVWDEDNNIAYELFGAARPSDPVTMAGTPTGGQWHAAQETIWNMKTDAFRTLGYTSADAAGLSILAGLVRPDEGLATPAGQGAITHALRFTLPSGDVDPQYIYPASHIVGVSTGADKLPFGARLRLMNTPSVNGVIATLGPEAQIIAKAMQQYGLVLADIGSAMYVTGTSAAQDANNNISLTWNMNDVLGLSALNAGDFQVVDLTPVVTHVSPTSAVAGSTITITGQNFSGAAGHLSVFFGSTAATSVTFVSDTQITAVIPNGSGTVNVTVQSGVNETDNVSSNPNANVTKPIFGYGTSAITPADSFTYSGQTVSAANSTASFASSSVASGNTDLLTIVVKDTTSNAVSGLAGSAFSFSLSGGTSAGTFGSVTATATAGTYTTTFTGTTAGTASSLAVAVTGVTLSTHPGITVTAGAVSPTNSSAAFTSPTVPTGGTDTLTIVVEDAAGNAVTGLANSVFGLALSGGTSAGTFGPVAATATAGTYTTTFTGTTPGTAATLTTTVGGVTLAGQPTIQVIAGAIDGTVFHDSNADGVQDSGELGLAGQTVYIDLNGSGAWQPGDPTALTDANGNYKLTVLSAGTYTVRQSLLGGELLSKPAGGSYQVTLAAGATVAGQNFADVLTSIAVPLTLRPSTTFPAQGNANADYVEAVYRAILDRNADAGGLAYWTSQLNTGALSRLQVVQTIRSSPEHYSQEVSALYLTLLKRPADQPGLQYWMQQLEAGMREEQVASAFLESPEYLSQGDKHFVDAMYQSLLGRAFDPAGELFWLGQLGDDASGNPTHPAAMTHEQVIAAFLYSTETENRLTEGYYEVFLRRPADPLGLNSWLEQLHQGMPFWTVGQQVLSSDEFYNWAAQQG